MALTCPQCSIPAFEGLLPEPHNQIVMDLLSALAEWHALAKLRMHDEDSVQDLERLTVELGDAARRFSAETCMAYKTTELPREQQARLRRSANAAARVPEEPVAQSTAKAKEPKVKTLNMKTYKWHALGDYPALIREVGTSDNVSSQLVSHHLSQHWHG